MCIVSWFAKNGKFILELFGLCVSLISFLWLNSDTAKSNQLNAYIWCRNKLCSFEQPIFFDVSDLNVISLIEDIFVMI